MWRLYVIYFFVSNSNDRTQVLFENSKGQVEELEIVETKERHGLLRRALPVLSVPLAAVCCVLNIFPGLGEHVTEAN